MTVSPFVSTFPSFRSKFATGALPTVLKLPWLFLCVFHTMSSANNPSASLRPVFLATCHMQLQTNHSMRGCLSSCSAGRQRTSCSYCRGEGDRRCGSAGKQEGFVSSVPKSSAPPSSPLLWGNRKLMKDQKDLAGDPSEKLWRWMKTLLSCIWLFCSHNTVSPGMFYFQI